MKICKIYIKDFQQFKNLELDFTHPDTGEPLDKICFIGSNGTGKSTIIKIINDILLRKLNNFENLKFVLKLKLNKKYIYCLHNSKVSSTDFFFNNDIEKGLHFINDLFHIPNIYFNNKSFVYSNQNGLKGINEELILNNNSDLVIYSPPESAINSYMSTADVPNTSLNEALGLFYNFPCHHIISEETVTEFWKILIFHLKNRDNERETYENLPDNINKTKRQLIEEFDKINPKILDNFSTIWNRILAKTGLEFDIKNASNPIQLSDNLKAYIKLKSTGEKINYNQLSTGIRNFIFRIGHIYSLYFNREIKRGFLLIDEPENSLYPDFLFDLVDIYQEIIRDKNNENNTQLFMATHNPIIAAQFAPYERIVLDWNEDGSVKARKGTAPTGDDPNDILTEDFELKNLMGKEGQRMWEKYVDLKKQLSKASKKDEKERLISEISKIGTAYNFS